jgi:hypothetical protein
LEIDSNPGAKVSGTLMAPSYCATASRDGERKRSDEAAKADRRNNERRMKIPRGMFFLGTVEIASGADGNARSLLAELGEICLTILTKAG